jgi:hypothetical protein
MLADYETEHSLDPAARLQRLSGRGGCFGHGTVVRYDLTVGGRAGRTASGFEGAGAGRTLTETDLETGATTTFDVTPTATGSRVEITTEYRTRGGIRGFLERLLPRACSAGSTTTSCSCSRPTPERGDDGPRHSRAEADPSPPYRGKSTTMSADLPICVTCGAQLATVDPPPDSCPICNDDRQYVRAGGQAWTTLAAMRGTTGTR